MRLLLALTVLGALWRVASYGYNLWPHGDVVIDAAIAESVARRGELLVPFVDIRYYPTDRFGFGYPLDQHPPLWPLLGAPLVWLTGDGYVALKLVSLLVGIGLVPLAYLALRRWIGAGPALFAAGLTAASYPLVDFSGNGSLWALLAAAYLGWLWALPLREPGSPAITPRPAGDGSPALTPRPAGGGSLALTPQPAGGGSLALTPQPSLPLAGEGEADPLASHPEILDAPRRTNSDDHARPAQFRAAEHLCSRDRSEPASPHPPCPPARSSHAPGGAPPEDENGRPAGYFQDSEPHSSCHPERRELASGVEGSPSQPLRPSGVATLAHSTGHPPRTLGRWALVGLVMGLGYLTNYPALVLPVALVGLHLAWHGRQALQPRRLLGPARALAVLAVVILPWLVYTATLFGSPVWSQPFQRTLAGGSRQVEYLVVDGSAIKRNLPATASRLTGLRERAIDLYGNVGFVAKQSLVLTPVLGGLFLVGLLLLVPSPAVPFGRWQARGLPLARAPEHHPADPVGLPLARARERGAGGEGTSPAGGEGTSPAGGEGTSQPGGRSRSPDADAAPVSVLDPLPVAVLAVVHLALIIWWPTTKFRYLIPLLPLVFGIGSWCLWQLRPPGVRARFALVTAGLCLLTNVWTMLSIPSRTLYYDGGLMPDNFGQQGERIFAEDARHFRAAADVIVTRGPGVVLGDHILAPFTRMPLVVHSTGYPPAVVEHLVRTYDIRYIVSDTNFVSTLAFLEPAILWSDERLTVLELPTSRP